MKYLVSEKTASFLRKMQQSGGYAGKSGPTRREVPSRGIPDLYPPPFTVRWSQSENDGAGAWCIWLPHLSKLFAYGGTYAALTGVTACNVLPTGWYTVDDSTGATDTAVYLVVTLSDAGAVTSAVVSVTQGQAVTGTTVANVPVAAMSVDATTGAKSVKQFVDSAVLLGGGGGGSVTLDDVSLDWNDDGEAQIKDFDTGTPADENTISDYLQGVANIPSAGIMFVCRTADSDGASLFYLPLAKLFTGGSTSGNLSLSFIGDIRWNMTDHTIEKRVDSVNLRTGAVTQGNWAVITNGTTTSHSSL